MKHDFYTGFEGEPEIRVSLRRKGKVVCVIRVWSGYFSELMSSLPLGTDGWRGIALHYNLDTGWYDTSPWVDPDIADSARQLRYAADRCLEATTKEFGESWIELLEEASKDPDAVVMIEYD